MAANGTGFVANTTFMPGVTAEMFNWWFGWHSVTSDLRYKIWDHDDHWYARADNPDYVKDPSVPVSQKTWGVNHEILEDIGMGADPLLLCFRRPPTWDMTSPSSALTTAWPWCALTARAAPLPS